MTPKHKEKQSKKGVVKVTRLLQAKEGKHRALPKGYEGVTKPSKPGNCASHRGPAASWRFNWRPGLCRCVHLETSLNAIHVRSWLYTQ